MVCVNALKVGAGALRSRGHGLSGDLMAGAADEIERLRKALEAVATNKSLHSCRIIAHTALKEKER